MQKTKEYSNVGALRSEPVTVSFGARSACKRREPFVNLTRTLYYGPNSDISHVRDGDCTAKTTPALLVIDHHGTQKPDAEDIRFWWLGVDPTTGTLKVPPTAYIGRHQFAHGLLEPLLGAGTTPSVETFINEQIALALMSLMALCIFLMVLYLYARGDDDDEEEPLFKRLDALELETAVYHYRLRDYVRDHIPYHRFVMEIAHLSEAELRTELLEYRARCKARASKMLVFGYSHPDQLTYTMKMDSYMLRLFGDRLGGTRFLEMCTIQIGDCSKKDRTAVYARSLQIIQRLEDTYPPVAGAAQVDGPALKQAAYVMFRACPYYAEGF